MKFEKVSGYLEKIESVSSRLEMTDLLAELFKEADYDEIDKIVYLCQGRLAPEYAGLEIGMGEKFVEEAISKISGYSKAEVHQLYKKLGDLGLVAEEVVKKKKQKALFAEELTLNKVFNNLLKIAKASGPGSQEFKIKLLSELLNSAKPKEAKYITRIPLGHLRLGTGDPTMMDAFAIIYLDELKKDKKIVKEMEKGLKEKKKEKREEELRRKLKFRVREMIEERYNIHSDLGHIGKLLKENGLKGLEKVKITPGIPIRPTLAERLPTSKEIIEKIGKCAVEAKYDGFRFQVHKDGKDIIIFSRRSENMTNMFPEIVAGAKEQIKAKEAIIEGEALAFNEQTSEFYPFQVTMQRKRKYEVKKMAEEFPLKLFVFDVMMINGKNLMDLPFRERRKILEKAIEKGKVIELTKSIITDNPKNIDRFFEENIEKGLEGIIAKDLGAKYIAGARKFAWIKLKRSYKGSLEDTVDAVIIGYFKGRGQRAKFGLGALLTAVYDEGEDIFKSIAKVGSGFTEERMVELEKRLNKIKKESKPARADSEQEPDVWVEPRYVIEVRADEITKSPMHTAGRTKREKAGFALRFPRMISFRADRKPEQATTVKEIIGMFKKQKHLKTEG